MNIKLGSGPYIRFGQIPTTEQSKAYGENDKTHELGVSCYECLKVGDKYRIIYPPINERWNKSAGILSIMIKRFLLGQSKCYLINGNVVGRGTDNEPLLKNVSIVKELTINDFKTEVVI